jgi:voltage-gated potassium channel
MEEAEVLITALKSSWHKILVFLYTVLTLAVIFGSLLYVVEGSAAGFTSIPKSVYWAIVTLTTVGYGDIAPQTPLGQIIASSIMIMGYGIIYE